MEHCYFTGSPNCHRHHIFYGPYRKKSEEYLEKSLSLIERTVGKGHSLYSASLNNLAIQYYNNGDFENALKYFEESAEICMQAFGKDSSSYRSLLQNIEIVRERLGK